MRKTILLCVVAAVVAAAVVGQVLAGGPGSSHVSLSLFKRPQTVADRLPKDRAVWGSSHFASLDSRLVGHYHGATWYAVPGKDRTICLVGIDDKLSWGTCTDAAVLKQRVIYDGWENARHAIDVAALANDGLTRVTYSGGSTRIRNNAFFVTLPKRDLTMRLTGPGQPTHTVRLPFGSSR